MELAPHQQRVVNKLMHTHLHGLVACHVMGSGKTRTAAACALVFLQKNPSSRVIFVVKRAVMQQFVNEVMKYFQSHNRPTLALHFTTFTRFTNSPLDTRENMLIIDEVHYVNTHIALAWHGSLDTVWQHSTDPADFVSTGKAAASLIRASARAAKVLLLTGTPIVNYPKELANIIAMAHGYTYPVNATMFTNVYLSARKTPQNIYGEALRALFRNSFDFHPPCYPEQETDLGPYFPQCSYHDVCIPMDPQYLEAYRYIEQNMEVRARSRKKRADETLDDHLHSAFYVGLRTAANATLGAAEVAAKTKWVADKIVRQPDLRVVVFSSFKKHGLFPLFHSLKASRVPAVMVTGDSNEADIAQAVYEYNNHQARVLLISSAGAEGLDLRETDIVVLLESAWNENRLRQAVCRAVRHGSHSDGNKAMVHVIRLHHVKPVELKGGAPDTLPVLRGERNSVDLFLKNYAMRKDMAISKFWDFVKKEPYAM